MTSLADLVSGLGMSDEQKKLTAWNNARAVPDHPLYRYDCDNRLICWPEYGKYSEYGWQIDHITPVALGGIDVAHNLRARHWQGNSSAGGLLGGILGGLGKTS